MRETEPLGQRNDKDESEIQFGLSATNGNPTRKRGKIDLDLSLAHASGYLNQCMTQERSFKT